MNLQQLIALQKASGGQNVITPDNAGRIMGLAAQQEANRQLSMDAGRLAVEERKRLQQLEAGQTPGVVTTPSGARFVTDAQGNVVGTNAPLTGGTMLQNDKGVAAGRGETPSSSLGERIRSAFQTEMQKRAPVAPSPPTQQEQNQKFIEKTAPFNTPPIPDSQTPAAIPNQQELAALLSLVSSTAQNAAVEPPRRMTEEEMLRSAEEAPQQQAREASMRDLESLKKQRANILEQLRGRVEVSLPISASGMTMPFSRVMQSESRAQAAAKARELEKQIAALEAALK